MIESADLLNKVPAGAMLSLILTSKDPKKYGTIKPEVYQTRGVEVRCPGWGIGWVRISTGIPTAFVGEF